MSVEKRIENLERELAATKAQREKAEADAREAQIVSATEDALRAARVPADKIRAAVAMIHHADKRVVIADNGAVAWARYPNEAWVGESDLHDGIADWLKSPEGEFFREQRSNAKRPDATGEREADVHAIVGKLFGGI